MSAYSELTLALMYYDPNCRGRAREFVDYAPEDTPTAGEAEVMCSGCPVFTLCEEYAREACPPGVWGGRVYPESERRDDE